MKKEKFLVKINQTPVGFIFVEVSKLCDKDLGRTTVIKELKKNYCCFSCN